MSTRKKKVSQQLSTKFDEDSFLAYNNLYAQAEGKKEIDLLWNSPTLEDLELKLRSTLSSFIKTPEIPESESYACKKCGNKRVQLNRIQTRAADESDTLFLDCRKCGTQTRID
jgi:DNA-directed RNA polymerase subunit M/transcription elongation factor TFIIS